MEITSYNINRIYRFCDLLKEEVIKQEIEEIAKGYTLKSIDKNDIKFTCILKNDNDEIIKLLIGKNEIRVIKKEKYSFEYMVIDENLLLINRTIEKRPKGFIYSILEKKFSANNRFKEQAVLVDLLEESFSLTKESVSAITNQIDFEKDDLKKVITKFMYIEGLGRLKEKSDLYTCFSTHMNHYYKWHGARQITDNFYPTKTYLNNEDLSRLYDVTEGHDKLYRVYDLYKGTINERNLEDIKLINKEFLSRDAFDLKTLREINEQEDLLLGESFIKNNVEYLNYLKTCFYELFGYRDELEDNRESILSGITHIMSGPEFAKREIEKELGIPYEEFDKLDIDEQHKLIKQKTGRTYKPDDRTYVDGIPMDDEHIIKMDEVDNHFVGTAKRVLRRFKNKFNKK